MIQSSILPSCKVRQVIALRCCTAFVYIILHIRIYPSQSTRDTSIAQHKHLTALGCIHIVVGIEYSSVWGLHGSYQSAIFGLRHFTRVAVTASTAVSGGHTSAPHWVRSWAGPHKCVSIEKQAHAMVQTKDLYSAYCPTGGCTHHSLFAWVCHQWGSCILMHALVKKYMCAAPTCACVDKGTCHLHVCELSSPQEWPNNCCPFSWWPQTPKQASLPWVPHSQSHSASICECNTYNDKVSKKCRPAAEARRL